MVSDVTFMGVEFFTEAILNISVSVTLGILLTIFIINILRVLSDVIVVYLEEKI